MSIYYMVGTPIYTRKLLAEKVVLILINKTNQFLARKENQNMALFILKYLT
jgi:hypothetical protein